MHEESFDYIVVGAGSAGAVVATRLSEDPDVSVLLIEAGPEDRSYWTRLPLGFGKILFQDRYVPHHMSEPEAEMANRAIRLPYGSLLGGSSAINGLIYIRGASWDYDQWQALGAAGWSYKDVLPAFKKIERHYKGASAYHGDSGPFGVERARWRNDVADALLDAAQSLGVQRNDDMNGATIEGCFYNELATWNGRRSSTSLNYLEPNRHRTNFTIWTEAPVQRVDFEQHRAVGVTLRRDGAEIRVRARREVVLSAGALHTPKLLQLSGIGPGGLLQSQGIPIIADLQGVGSNLMDHLSFVCPFSTTSRDTFNKRVNSVGGLMREAFNYYLGKRDTPFAVGAGLAGMYTRSRPDVRTPDIQVGMAPFMPGARGYDLAKDSGFFVGAFQCRPESRGSVSITSTDAAAPPRVAFNHLSTPLDVQTSLDAMKFILRIAGTGAFERVNAKLVAPLQGASDDVLLDYIRSTSSTSFHYSGTARMGEDPAAVVDPQLRVRGVSNLRVIDASVMPVVVSTNTNAATIMIGERGAEFIKRGAAHRPLRSVAAPQPELIDA